MTIAELILKLQALPDHSRPIYVETQTLGQSEDSGCWLDPTHSEPHVHDFKHGVVIEEGAEIVPPPFNIHGC